LILAPWFNSLQILRHRKIKSTRSSPSEYRGNPLKSIPLFRDIGEGLNKGDLREIFFPDEMVLT